MLIPNETNRELTTNGRLKNLADWNEDIAKALAKMDGLALGAAHLEIINLMRNYYHTYNIPPIKKLLKKEIREKLGEEKAADAYLDKLFPNGVLVQGTKLAGLPIPILDAEIEEMHATKAIPEAKHVEVPVHFIGEFEFEGEIYRVHPKGNLVDADDWSEHLAEFLALNEGIQLTPEHWEVIHYLRKFYFRYGITPMVRLLMKHMREELGSNRSSHDYLYQLFPGGPSRQGSRIAGLPEPQGCIDG